MSVSWRWATAVVILAWAISGLAAVPEDPASVTLRPVAAAAFPRIDGQLDDEVWKNGPILDRDFITYNPLFGDILPQRTQVFLAYDRAALYVAFRCRDTEPEKIKTSVCRRDSLFNDDWVGFSLESLGNRQSSFEFFVNPNGIQGDIFSTAATGEDSAPDWVWDSAGAVTTDGYQVEIRIPWRSIRFKSGHDVTMGILFWRRISRLGQSGSWPAITPGAGIFNIHAPLFFPELASPQRVEVLPSFTCSRDQDRLAPEQWGEADSAADFGVGAKVGITSTTTADITVNPDFSQVESDAFQVEVNRRYPIFFEEKRPFFMESMGIFNLSGTGGDTYMYTAVHTRRIVDPLWGAKLVGSQGRVSFGVLAAGDEWPGQTVDGEVNPDEGEKANFAILRGTFSLGSDNYVGGLYSGREFAGGFNRVAGADAQFRFWGPHQVAGFVLRSESRDEHDGARTGGTAACGTYSYSTKPLDIWFAAEHYDPDFRMDTAFYNRTGFRRATLYLGPLFYPSAERTPWLKKVNPFIFCYALHDTVSDLNDYLLLLGLRFNFTRQGQFRVDFIRQQEGWAERVFEETGWQVRGNVQATNWLRLDAYFFRGDSIYYDPDDPFLGKGLSASVNVTLQPDPKTNLSLGYSRESLRDPVDARGGYVDDILNFRATYQLNKYLFFRATIRYDSFRLLGLTDFLVSYTYIPGTVLFLGYGSLYERTAWREGQWETGPGSWEPMRRGLFFKVSYLWQL